VSPGRAGGYRPSAANLGLCAEVRMRNSAAVTAGVRENLLRFPGLRLALACGLGSRHCAHINLWCNPGERNYRGLRLRISVISGAKLRD
jgi:hypothetical protein